MLLERYKNAAILKWETQLMHILELLGVDLILTPYYHSEIARQIIEDGWGYSKLRFWCDFHNLIAKNLKEDVLKTLDCLMLRTNWLRKFVRKAWEYTLTYALIFHLSDGADAAVWMDDIEYITKEFKVYCLSIYVDYVFIGNS